MQTDKIFFDNESNKISEVLQQVEKVAIYNSLSHKQMLQLSLLAEELIGIHKGILDFIHGEFYIENVGSEYYLHLKTDSNVDTFSRDEFKEISTSGKNSAYKGFKGKLRMIADTLIRGEQAVGGCYEYNYKGYTMDEPFSDAWVLSLDTTMHRNVRNEWDGYEKSILANLADEIVVGHRNTYVEIIVIKKFE